MERPSSTSPCEDARVDTAVLTRCKWHGLLRRCIFSSRDGARRCASRTSSLSTPRKHLRGYYRIHHPSSHLPTITMPMEDIKTVYQQRHGLPSTYAAHSGQLHGLHRISLVKNSKWTPSARHSLGHLVKKFEITPTLPSPFTFVQDILANNPLQRFKPETHLALTRSVGRMLSTDGTTDRKGGVEAQNIQDDSEYLAQVGVGTPVQAMNLNFDTGSSDL